MSVLIPFLKQLVENREKILESVYGISAEELKKRDKIETIKIKILKDVFLYGEIENDDLKKESLKYNLEEAHKEEIARKLYEEYGLTISKKASNIFRKLSESGINIKIRESIENYLRSNLEIKKKKNIKVLILDKNNKRLIIFEYSKEKENELKLNKLKKISLYSKKKTEKKHGKTKSSKKSVCIICKKEFITENYESLGEKISEVIPWLVGPKKNVAYVREWSVDGYIENISICESCIDIIEKLGSEFLDSEKCMAETIISNVKIFPYIVIRNENDVNFIIEQLKAIKDYIIEGLDSVFRFISSERIFIESFYDLMFYRKEQKKINIIGYIEDIRLSNIKIIYDVLEKINGNLFKENNNIFYFLRDISKENKKEFEILYINLIRKILKLERLSKNEEKLILSIINKKLSKIFYDIKENYSQKRKVVDSIFLFIKFLNMLDSELVKNRGQGILDKDSLLRFNF